MINNTDISLPFYHILKVNYFSFHISIIIKLRENCCVNDFYTEKFGLISNLSKQLRARAEY